MLLPVATMDSTRCHVNTEFIFPVLSEILIDRFLTQVFVLCRHCYFSSSPHVNVMEEW